VNTHIDDLGQADEEILTTTLSDEALEAAAATDRAAAIPDSIFYTHCQIA
jgi:hypothetical protein